MFVVLSKRPEKRYVRHEYDGVRTAHRVRPFTGDRLSQVIWNESTAPNYELVQHEFFVL